ncbi:uncharacterized protein DS421_18g623540 [Arachis hypogaea]|nr:uncharacterized protein DS421_18g623540 [Arachis hypogaea]
MGSHHKNQFSHQRCTRPPVLQRVNDGCVVGKNFSVDDLLNFFEFQQKKRVLRKILHRTVLKMTPTPTPSLPLWTPTPLLPANCLLLCPSKIIFFLLFF